MALATNANYLTLRATDRAGNVTTTNFTVALDNTGATNPPTLQLTWPTNGMAVSGDSFYVRGHLSDETARIVAQVVHGDGFTNEYSGIVERSGTFWVEGLPLTAGTNLLQFIATDAAGNVTQSELTVDQSSLTVNVTGTPEGESLYDGVGKVFGTVSQSACSVSVNGVAATMDGTDWTAENVPILGEGTATFDVVVTPPSGPTTHLSVEKTKPAIIKVTKHLLKQVITGPDFDGGSYTRTWLKDYRLWQETVAGAVRLRYRGTASSFATAPSGYSGTDYAWSDTNVNGTAYSYSSWGSSTTNVIPEGLVASVPDRQLDHTESDVNSTTAFYV